jgi:hypothetical protein
VTTDIIAIDPGLVSGVAHVQIDDAGAFSVISTAELDPFETGAWLQDRLASVADMDLAVVAVERFTITPKTATNSAAPWSLEVIGQTRWIFAQAAPGRALVMQSPADAKTIFPNARLKELGLWHRGGKGHALDALRHAALVAHRLRKLSR